MRFYGVICRQRSMGMIGLCPTCGEARVSPVQAFMLVLSTTWRLHASLPTTTTLTSTVLPVLATATLLRLLLACPNIWHLAGVLKPHGGCAVDTRALRHRLPGLG